MEDFLYYYGLLNKKQKHTKYAEVKKARKELFEGLEEKQMLEARASKEDNEAEMEAILQEISKLEKRLAKLEKASGKPIVKVTKVNKKTPVRIKSSNDCGFEPAFFDCGSSRPSRRRSVDSCGISWSGFTLGGNC